MITEDYVSFETAKLLKEKGFQAKCTACYHSDPSHTFELISGRINYCNPRFRKYKMIPPYNAPTLQMAMKWLREVHKIGVFPSTYTNIMGTDITHVYGTAIVNLNTYELMTNDCMGRDTFNEAVEVAIKYCIENLI